MIRDSENRADLRYPVTAYKTFDSTSVVKDSFNIQRYICESPKYSCRPYCSIHSVADSPSNYQVFCNRTSSGCSSTDEDDIKRKILCSSPVTMSEELDVNACDIEQCLMQIEESLLNIEQNLLHVKDLEIPQLDNLLYSRSSVVNKKLHYACSLDNNYDRPFSEHWGVRGLLNLSNMRLSRSVNDIRTEKNFNFISNSHDELPLTSIIQESVADIINCNLKTRNSFDDKKHLNHHLKDNMSLLNNSKRTASQGALDKCDEDSFYGRKSCRELCIKSNIQSNECLFHEINAKAEEFRKKLKNITATEQVLRSSLTALDKASMTFNLDDKNEQCVADNDRGIKTKNINSRIHTLHSADSKALLPNKLLSLSFSLLLAALLQAVRCLADLVEDTFRSIAFDKYALHE